MWKHLMIVAIEIILVVAIGILTNLVSSSISINVNIVWFILILALLILIPATWLRDYENTGKAFSLPSLKASIPEQVTFSISFPSLKKFFSTFFVLILNAILFGGVTAYVSVMLIQNRFIDFFFGGIADWLYTKFQIDVLGLEVIGGLIIPFASIFIMRRLSTFLGLVFCVFSSLAFSVTHVNLLTDELLGITLLGNLTSYLILTIGLRFLYPVLDKILIRPVIDFWRGLFNPNLRRSE
jgi:hypothetical protein